MVGSLSAAIGYCLASAGGQCFFKGAAQIGFLALLRGFYCLHGIVGSGGLWRFRLSRTASLFYRKKMEFLCEEFEQIANKNQNPCPAGKGSGL